MIDRTRELLIPIGRAPEQENSGPTASRPIPRRLRGGRERAAAGYVSRRSCSGAVATRRSKPSTGSFAGFRRLNIAMHCTAIEKSIDGKLDRPSAGPIRGRQC